MELYRNDVSLQDYFEAVQVDVQRTPENPYRNRQVSNRLLNFAVRGADKFSRLLPRQKIKADVLFCPPPYFVRKTENQFLIRSLLGLARADAKILCLLPAYASCRDEMSAQLEAEGRRGQVIFLDPNSPLNRTEARLNWRVAQIRARAAFDKTVEILESDGLNPSEEAMAGFERLAYFVELWERLEPSIEFEAVVARCHWAALCSPVCRTARERGKRVVTFQQGVIGHSLDVPITNSKYVAFGQPSVSFLSRLNGRFCEAVGASDPRVEYVTGGSLFDTIADLPDQFDRQTLLIVDTQVEKGDFYGVGKQCQELLHVAERLLASNLPLRRVIIRPHPYWSSLDLEDCQQLVRDHVDRCELSHPVLSLEDDLRRSSVVMGIFSGVLTVASACGLPTIFLESENGYSTGDLACFGPGQTLQPDVALCEIGKMLTDRQAYAEARSQALRNASEYYAGGSALDPNGAFFERLLRTGPPTSIIGTN